MNDTLGPYPLNSIITGDCRELMAQLPAESIDLVVTSPPYDSLRKYNGYVFDFEGIACQLARILKPGGVIVWIVADQTVDGSESGTSFRQALYFMGLGLNLHDTMIYHKVAGATGSNLSYWQSFEYMFVVSKGKPKAINLIADRKNVVSSRTKEESIGHRNQDNSKKGYRIIARKEFGIRNNIWTYNAGIVEDKLANRHPAIFPEALARDHILSWSNPGDVVFDPMCGSGTTCKMAKTLGRLWLGFEISSEYADIARARVRNTQPPLFVPQPEQLTFQEA